MGSARPKSGDAPSFDAVAARVPFLRALPAVELDRLRPYAVCRRVRRGQAVWREGDATGEFTLLVQGRVKLVRAHEGGREVILSICGEGDLLCASAVCSFAPYCCASVAVEEFVDVVILPRRDVLALLERSPEASRAFLREVTAREMGLARRIDELSSGQVERRVTALLARLADQLGVPRADQGTWISISLSRQDLADLCGTTVETAIRVMTRLARDGVVQTMARGFLVTDKAALERIARGDGRCGG